MKEDTVAQVKLLGSKEREGDIGRKWTRLGGARMIRNDEGVEREGTGGTERGRLSDSN